eukprot:GHVN01023323.1.p1 GENE.GHVN01023323.1~~GHVN01023323.1.p1  ORF type:complete len:152 (-),score=7.87 GHVN01023323.1:254-709(-)
MRKRLRALMFIISNGKERIDHKSLNKIKGRFRPSLKPTEYGFPKGSHLETKEIVDVVLDSSRTWLINRVVNRTEAVALDHLLRDYGEINFQYPQSENHLLATLNPKLFLTNQNPARNLAITDSAINGVVVGGSDEIVMLVGRMHLCSTMIT